MEEILIWFENKLLLRLKRDRAKTRTKTHQIREYQYRKTNIENMGNLKNKTDLFEFSLILFSIPCLLISSYFFFLCLTQRKTHIHSHTYISHYHIRIQSITFIYTINKNNLSLFSYSEKLKIFVHSFEFHTCF